AEPFQQKESDEGAEHILSAMGEVDDVEHAENDGKAEAQHGIKGAVYEADQELAEKGLDRDSEDHRHVRLNSQDIVQQRHALIELGDRKAGSDAAVLHQVEPVCDAPRKAEILLHE